jgi:hypothetical protein
VFRHQLGQDFILGLHLLFQELNPFLLLLHGIDKAYGIGKLRDLLHVSLQEMIYIGDALFVGGNDYPAEKAGVDSIPVKGPDETKREVSLAHRPSSLSIQRQRVWTQRLAGLRSTRFLRSLPRRLL